MKLEHWLCYDKEQAVIRIYANQPTHPSSPLHLHPNFTSTHCGLTLVEQCLNSVLNVKVLKGPSPWLWKPIDRLLELLSRVRGAAHLGKQLVVTPGEQRQVHGELRAARAGGRVQREGDGAVLGHADPRHAGARPRELARRAVHSLHHHCGGERVTLSVLTILTSQLCFVA